MTILDGLGQEPLTCELFLKREFCVKQITAKISENKIFLLHTLRIISLMKFKIKKQRNNSLPEIATISNESIVL